MYSFSDPSQLTTVSENYILENPEWKFDIIPEIMDGKNIADFVDPDIEEKLEVLEREEEKLVAQGFYDSEEEMVSPCSRMDSLNRTHTHTRLRSIPTKNEKPSSSKPAWE